MANNYTQIGYYPQEGNPPHHYQQQAQVPQQYQQGAFYNQTATMHSQVYQQYEQEPQFMQPVSYISSQQQSTYVQSQPQLQYSYQGQPQTQYFQQQQQQHQNNQVFRQVQQNTSSVNSRYQNQSQNSQYDHVQHKPLASQQQYNQHGQSSHQQNQQSHHSSNQYNRKTSNYDSRADNNKTHSNQQGSYINERQQRSANNHDKQFQNQTNQSPSQNKLYPQESDRQYKETANASPMNDFGDMGAAVKKYVENDPTKLSQKFHSTSINGSANVSRKEDLNPYRKHHGISVWDDYSSTDIPDPYQRFEDFEGMASVQINALYSAGFQAPTPIQAQTWPIAMKERDVISIAKTGSGKTLAFLLPGYKKINNKYGNRPRDINVLVLAPTRELATQIQEEADKFGSIAGYYSTCVYGGAPKRDQLKAISAGISVLVATPGRLNDFLDSNQVNISSVFYLVLDEADRMLDMGFEPQIRSIVRKLPRQRQTLMFSATWPEDVQRLAHDFLYEPIHIRLGSTHSGLQANENIQQHIILLRSGEEKDSELISLIRKRFEQRLELVLIFVARKNTCDFVTNMLNRVGIPASAMHGDRDQTYREKTLADFRSGTRPIMVATDVASRGIDVKGISGVINYDLPNSTEDYVHRIGRTGRAGNSGESFTFLTHSNDDVWKAVGIVEVMLKTNQHPPQEVTNMIDQLQRRQQQNKERRAAENDQFIKVLLVAEKPSVAKSMAEHLSGGRFRTRRGQSRANQIFEFIKWFGPAQQKCKLMVTSVVGHIFGLNFEDGRAKDLSTLFNAKVQKNIEDNTKKLRIVEHLQELGQESDYLYLWLDCDREGENIGFEVISLTKEFIHYDNVYRARFSALTPSELKNAYENPVRPDKYSAMSVDARQELDLKIGVAFSRLMTKSFLNMAKDKFFLKDQRVVSYGPCQTPTLWFCVQRYKEIKKFIAKQFYTVSLVLKMQGRHTTFQWLDGVINDAKFLQDMEADVKPASFGTIIEVVEETKTVSKPLGLNTVTLLKACSKGLGISPTAAMHSAEHLYTSGYISYPRTETTSYAPSFDLLAALEEQINHPNWGKVASYLLRSGRINRPDKGFDVGDHPPITPMRAATRDEFSKASEWKIYDYVTRHFIASLHDDMQYSEKTLVVDVNGYKFQHKWHEVNEKGFMFAMPWKYRSLNLNENAMRSNMQPGQQLPMVKFEKEEQYTKPPDYLQESELISLMDKHGIGTDASIPQHIKNIQDRHYVDVCGPGTDGVKGQVIKVFRPFNKNRGGGHQQQQERPTSRHVVPRGFGLAFLSCFEELDFELCEPSIRAYMEKQVSKIATGETDKNEVVSSNLKLFLEKFLYFQANLDKVVRYFAPKGQAGSNFSNNLNRNNNGGNRNGSGGNREFHENNENNFGQNFGQQRGRGSYRGGRGGRGGENNGFRGNTRGGYNRESNRGNYRGNGRGSFGRGGSNGGNVAGRKRGHNNQGPDDGKRQYNN